MRYRRKKGYVPLIDAACRQYPHTPRKELISAIYCRELAADGERYHDPHQLVPEHAELSLTRPIYVSRGGLKLAYALKIWEIEVRNKVCIDAGASTGGFTDCLLQAGARKVYAVDVGFNQLAYSLRRDERVAVHERMNIMDFHGNPGDPADIAVCDLSFRSIQGAASHLLSLTKEKKLIALIKPQFEFQRAAAASSPYPAEAEKQKQNTQYFDGIIRESVLRVQILKDTAERLLDEQVFTEKITASPIQGRGGNREFLAYLIPAAESGMTGAEMQNHIGEQAEQAEAGRAG